MIKNNDGLEIHLRVIFDACRRARFHLATATDAICELGFDRDTAEDLACVIFDDISDY